MPPFVGACPNAAPPHTATVFHFPRRDKITGTTAEGTKRQTDEAETSHLSPTAQSSCGNGTTRHDWGSAEMLTRSHLTPSGIDMRTDTRSAGASIGSRFTKYSRDAKARLYDAYATLGPVGVHLPPGRLDPSPANAAAGGFAYRRFEIRQPTIS